MAMAEEKNFENKIKRFIKSIGGYEVKFFANAYTRKGVPDILACVNGKFWGIEAKSSAGKPSELQVYNIRLIRAAGGNAMVVYPSAWEQLKLSLTGELDPQKLPEILK